MSLDFLLCVQEAERVWFETSDLCMLTLLKLASTQRS